MINTKPKDSELFTKFSDPDHSAETGELLYLIDTATGKYIDQKMGEIREWIPKHFDHHEDPLWPMYGNKFVTDLCEARVADPKEPGNNDFILVWRDVAFTYYKRFGRGTYVSRAMELEEVEQFLTELREALTSKVVVEDAAPDGKFPPFKVDESGEQPMDKTAELSLELAKTLVAVHDKNRLTHYTLRERRIMMAASRGYSPKLTVLASPSEVNNLIELLNEEGIAIKRPVPLAEYVEVKLFDELLAIYAPGMFMTQEQIEEALALKLGTKVMITIEAENPAYVFQVIKADDGSSTRIHISLTNDRMTPARMISGECHLDAWRQAYRMVFNKEPMHTQPDWSELD